MFVQMEFFAEEEVITVIPNVSFKTTDSSLICIGVRSQAIALCTRRPNSPQAAYALQGEWGPFRPNFPVEVPLWLALALQKKKCCRIQIPLWMRLDHLEGDQHLLLQCSGHMYKIRVFD